MSVDLSKLSESVVKGRIEEARELTEEATRAGVDVQEIMTQGLVVGMETVGQKWKADEMFMPEVIRSAKAMSHAMDSIREELEKTSSGMGTMVIGTVAGDLHDIGKNLAAMMFEGAGYKVINIGIDQPNDAFIEAVVEHKPKLLGISALLTTTMPRMGEIINGLTEAGIREEVAVIIGGAPVTDEFAQEINADIYAPNARAGVERAEEFFKSA